MRLRQNDFWQRHAPLTPERRTHIALADLLDVACLNGWWWSHIGHGEYRTERTGALLKRMGLKPGIADFLLISPAGVHHWLELKRRDARLSKYQEAFRDEMERRNVAYAVAHSYDEAVRQLEDWGVL